MSIDPEYWVWLKTEFFLEIQRFNQKMQKSLDFGTESVLSRFYWFLSLFIYNKHIMSKQCVFCKKILYKLVESV